jgi:hypothetical protein
MIFEGLSLAQLEVATDCKSVGHRFDPDNSESLKALLM